MLEAAGARLACVPSMGGGLAGLWRKDAGGALRPALRPWSGRVADGPFALACNLMLPFVGRLASPFSFAGSAHEVPPNTATEPCAIHGDGFQRPWRVLSQSSARLELGLDEGAIGPWRYRARAAYALGQEGLEASLAITAEGDAPLPYGFGFHPWFPQGPDTRLAFASSGVWRTDEALLPTEHVTPPGRLGLDFSAPRQLPEEGVDNCFTGWDGTAEIVQGPQDASLSLWASPLLSSWATLYAPSRVCGFFCLEPISHPPGAHAMDGQPGLRPLKAGETLEGSMRLLWRD